MVHHQVHSRQGQPEHALEHRVKAAEVVQRRQLGRRDRDQVVGLLQRGHGRLAETDAEVEDDVAEAASERLQRAQDELRRDQVGLLWQQRCGQHHQPARVEEDRAFQRGGKRLAFQPSQAHQAARRLQPRGQRRMVVGQ